jgi:DNA-binding transcriptional MerR regulator
MEHLRQHVSAGYRYLVIELITGKAMITDGKGVFRRPGGPGWMQLASVDLSFILEQFDQEAPPREAFTLTEVAQMTQQKSPTVHAWVKAGVLTPSIRDRDGTRGKAMLFSRLDAFTACLVASLKRKCGLPLAKLEEISSVLNALESPQSVNRLDKSSNRRSIRKARGKETVAE